MESRTENNNAVTHVTTRLWDEEVLKSDVPVLVDFWAEWCGPCRMVGPAVEQVGKIMAGKVKVTKLNVDENQEIAMRYNVQSIPSLLLFKGGKEVGRTIGAAPKERYLTQDNSHWERRNWPRYFHLILTGTTKYHFLTGRVSYEKDALFVKNSFGRLILQGSSVRIMKTMALLESRRQTSILTMSMHGRRLRSSSGLMITKL
jgi:thioredoxin 1